LQGEPADHVVWNVVQEDHPQPDAAEEIEPQVALDRVVQPCRNPLDHGTHPSLMATPAGAENN